VAGGAEWIRHPVGATLLAFDSMRGSLGNAWDCGPHPHVLKHYITRYLSLIATDSLPSPLALKTPDALRYIKNEYCTTEWMNVAERQQHLKSFGFLQISI